MAIVAQKDGICFQLVKSLSLPNIPTNLPLQSLEMPLFQRVCMQVYLCMCCISSAGLKLGQLGPQVMVRWLKGPLWEEFS